MGQFEPRSRKLRYAHREQAVRPHCGKRVRSRFMSKAGNLRFPTNSYEETRASVQKRLPFVFWRRRSVPAARREAEDAPRRATWHIMGFHYEIRAHEPDETVRNDSITHIKTCERKYAPNMKSSVHTRSLWAGRVRTWPSRHARDVRAQSFH